MKPSDLKQRTKQFALSVIDLTESLPRNSTFMVLGRQLLRSGTSVGANYRAVCRARSAAVFAHKVGIVIEEADESAFWLELIMEKHPSSEAAKLHKEADELTAIMVASRKTALANENVNQG